MISGFFKNLLFYSRKNHDIRGDNEYIISCVSILKNDIGASLVSCIIYNAKTKKMLGGINTQESIGKLVYDMKKYINSSLTQSNLPLLQDFIIIELDGNHFLIVYLVSDYQVCTVVNKKSINLGYLFNVTFPNLRSQLIA